MSVASEINRIKTAVADAYDSAEAKGATIPATKNVENLADTIDTITGGGGGENVPLSVDKNGRYVAPSGKGYSPVNVDVPSFTTNYHGNHIVDGIWVRPTEYPNLEALPLIGTDGTVYFTYDTNYEYAWISMKDTTTGSRYKKHYEIGYVQNGEFITIYDYPNVAYNASFSYIFTDEDKALSRYWVVRLTGRIKTAVLASLAYTHPEATTSRTLALNAQPLVERYGDLPYATSIICTTKYLESDYIKTTGALTTLNGCYSTNYNLQRVKRDNWDVSNVTSFSSLFNDCYCLEDVDTDFTGWVTSKCTSISSMFDNCRALRKAINVTDWDTTNVTTIAGLFNYCMNVPKIIGVEDLYFPNVTTLYGSTAYTFGYCLSLEGELDLRNWNIGEIATVGSSVASAFTYCRKITKIDISTWDLSSITSMASTFAYCESAEEILLPDGIGANGTLTSITSVFTNCLSLQSVDLSKINLSVCTNITSLCNICYNLTEFIPPTTEPVGSSSSSAATLFNYCTSLEELDLSWYDCSVWTSSTVQYAGLLSGCKNLKTLIPFRNANKSFSVSECIALSRESIVALLNACDTKASGTQTITLGGTLLAKLSDDDIAIITGKGWTLK